MIKLTNRSLIMTQDEALPGIREADGTVTYVDGKPVKSNPSQFTLRCNVQPLTGAELLLVPEADRARERLWLHSVVSESNPRPELGDKLLREGRVYHVQRVEDWGSFVKSHAVRVDVGPSEVALFGPVDEECC